MMNKVIDTYIPHIFPITRMIPEQCQEYDTSRRQEKVEHN